MGEENFPDLVPWLFDSLKTDNSNVERSGAAQGLSETKAINLKMNTCYDYDVILPEENTSFWNLQTSFNQVLSALGTGYFEHVLPDIIRNCSHQKASVRDGYLTLFKVLPAILDGLANENESVRDAALGADHVLVEHYATTYAFIVVPCFFVFSWRWIEIYFCSYMSLPLLLPAVEDGIFNDNQRIRQSSVELLGDLLFKVAGTSGKALLEGGSDDEGSSTEAYGRRDKRNEILAALYMVRTDVSLSMRQAALHVWKAIMANTAALYMVRTDVSLSMRQAALHVWKAIMANTPKTFKEIMPVLMNTLISSLASASSERQQVVAARALSELVRKLGERVLPLTIPILS
ncbi:translational activator GCN1 [Populus alba x Populus x berolinensis]|nr:translational activator GCN1 [Populus alba x Populus x berolinensis]